MNPTPERTEKTPRSEAARINECELYDGGYKPSQYTSLEVTRTLETELNAAKESAEFWEKACERERAQRQLEVGSQEYRGNTVAYMYDKAKCYGDMVHGCSPALAAAGFPPDEFAKDGQVGAIARAVADMAEEMSNVHAQNEALRGALEGLLEWADTMKAAYEHPFLNDTALQNARNRLTTTPPAKA